MANISLIRRRGFLFLFTLHLALHHPHPRSYLLARLGDSYLDTQLSLQSENHCPNKRHIKLKIQSLSSEKSKKAKKKPTLLWQVKGLHM